MRKPEITADQLLLNAQQHMVDRSQTYDSEADGGERSIGRTVELFNVLTGDGRMHCEERGWLFMLLLKLVRSQQGAVSRDSYEDGAAYFALAGEAALQERGGQK